MARHAVIVDALRTAIARAGADRSALREIRADDLGARCVKALHDRNQRLDPAEIDDVVFGCANQSGEQSLNIGRMIALLAELPVEVAGATVDRQCGSGLQAINMAAHAIVAGAADVIIAGGVESMTRVPMGSGMNPNPRLFQMFPPEMASMGLTAERLAIIHGISRADSDRFALRSNQLAVAARELFREEILPVQLADGRIFDTDQGPRPDTTPEKLASLRPVFKPEGQVTAGNSSQTSDGAAALLLMSNERAQSLGMQPLARIVATSAVGVSPEIMGWGPVPATYKALKHARLAIDDLGLVEINEAFAAQVLACNKTLGVSEDRLNVNGGAVALGHPLGCSGARLMVTLIHEMRRRRVAFGLVTLCIGIGQGIATIIESI
jgi:acetyl-CoA acyltransferase